MALMRIYIHTHFGIGYRFAPEPLAAGSEKKSVGAVNRGGDGTGAESHHEVVAALS